MTHARDPSATERRDAGIRAARALGDSRNFRGAADTLRRALGEDPDHAEAHYLLGLYLHNLGRHAEAVTACRAAVALGPENPIAHRLLGIALGAAPSTKGHGLAHLDQAVSLSPADGFNHYFRARALVGLARHRQALAAYLEACNRAPTEAQILAGTAEFLFSTHRVRKARDFAARAFASEPDDLGALTAEARSRLVGGRPADARDLARAAVALNATHRPAVAVLVEADMCRNPVFAVWSRLKSWCMGGRLRAAVLLIGACQAVSMIVMTIANACPTMPEVGVVALAACLVLLAWPGVVFRRRVAAALRPVRLKKRF